MAALLLERLYGVIKDFPEKKAIIEKGKSTSYAELGCSIAKLARHLSSLISRGDRVAILLENSAEYVVSCYAVWAAGGIVVGLNTALKATDLENLLLHCDARLLIADAKHRELKKVLSGDGHSEHLLLVGDNAVFQKAVLWSQVVGSQEPAPAISECNAEQAPDAPAKIIYTSGTTGHPKGVVLSHENLSTNVTAIQQYLAIRPDDKIMCVLPFYYSYGSSVLHTHLSCGASLVLENSFMYPHKVMERMVEEKVTAFSGVPSTYYLLMARTKLAEYDLSSLRYCTQAGGAMDSHKIQLLLDLLPEVDFFVMYGQTEAAARLTYLPPEKLQEKLGSVGVPISGVELSVRDAEGNELAAGQQGEVCAQGKNVMIGYWCDEDETAKVKKGGWLYTGDLGYVDNDGYYFLIGRNKEMIKTGAHRISPREIEELISQVPGVSEIAVIGVDDDVMGQVIKACVVADVIDGQTTNESNDGLKKNIQRFCREKLAQYKIPKEVVFCQHLPKTASGKIKKHLL